MLLISILLILYAVFTILLKIGLSRKYLNTSGMELSVSVIVAARNEADNIKKCLTSLNRLDYPFHLLDIFIVNDRSVDETENIILEFIKDKSHFKYLRNGQASTSLSGKAKAISLAIKQSRREIILITDADCEVPKNWIRNMTSYFQSEVGIVAGFTKLKDSGFFSRIQLLDWAFMLTVASSSVGIGIPLTCIGNNFAFRRKAYDDVGGYENVGFSVTEDFALLQTIINKTNWKVVAPINSQSIVQSNPVNNFLDFFKQRKRWAIGGKSVHWFGKLLIAVYVFIHAAFFSLLIFGEFLSAVITFDAVLFCDLLLLLSTLKKISKVKRLVLLPLYKIFSFFYMIILFLILIFNQAVEWKGEKY